MKHGRRAFVAGAAAFVAAFVADPAFALYDPKPDDVLAAVQGVWRGTLTYRDYRQPDRLVTLQTRLYVALSAPNELALHYVFDDGPGKTVYSYESMRFDFAANGVVWTSGENSERSSLDIQRSTVDGAMRLLVFERRKDRDTERFTMSLSATAFELAKDEVDAAGVASFRNRFVFTRA